MTLDRQNKTRELVNYFMADFQGQSYEYTDGFIEDTLWHGHKGFNQMTDAELEEAYQAMLIEREEMV